MTRQERDAAAMLLGGLAETLGQKITPARIAGVLTALDDVPLDLFEAAVTKARQVCEFIPAPVKLREFALEAERLRPRLGLPPVDENAEAARIAESWRGKEDEVRAAMAALPKGPSGRTVTGTIQKYAEQRFREMQGEKP